MQNEEKRGREILRVRDEMKNANSNEYNKHHTESEPLDSHSFVLSILKLQRERGREIHGGTILISLSPIHSLYTPILFLFSNLKHKIGEKYGSK